MKTLPYLRREHLLWAVRNVAAFITYWMAQIQGDLAKTPRLWAWRRTWKWRLVFAFIGATSWGLIAFGFNVVFDRLGNPTFATSALLFASQPPQDETNRRLWRANSHSGEVEVTLKWESRDRSGFARRRTIGRAHRVFQPAQRFGRLARRG